MNRAAAPPSGKDSLASRSMGLIITGTAGLVIWIVLWATNLYSGFDSILIGILMVVVAIGIRNLLPYLPGRRH